MSEPDLTESVDPAAAFAALSDDTRVDILRALWAADDETGNVRDIERSDE